MFTLQDIIALERVAFATVRIDLGGWGLSQGARVGWAPRCRGPRRGWVVAVRGEVAIQGTQEDHQ